MTKATQRRWPWRRGRGERGWAPGARAPPARRAAVLQRRGPGGRGRPVPARAGPRPHRLGPRLDRRDPGCPAVAQGELLELTTVPRSVDFYQLYQAMSENLLDNYVDRYDWVSWPDQDEFLEGPDRGRSYREWLYEVASSPYDWIQFNNFNFWWTPADDVGAERVAQTSAPLQPFPRLRAPGPELAGLGHQY